jgi:histidine triad (HIT) family protein
MGADGTDGAVVGDCRFCHILAGDMAAHMVIDEPGVAAFLDSRPVFPGHVLVVPRDHYQTLTDLPADVVTELFLAVQRSAAGVTTAMGAHGTFVAMNNTVSQSVPHLHVHVVPRRFKDGLRGFFWPRQRYRSEEEADTLARRIRSAIRAAG